MDSKKFLFYLKRFLQKHPLLWMIVSRLSGRKIFLYVITYAHNAGDDIELCLQSVYNQRYDKRFYRHLVINDASDDATATVVRKFMASHENHCVEYVEQPQLLGRIQSLRQWCYSAKSNMVIIEFNSDYRFDNKNLFQSINRIYSDPHVWVACGYKNGKAKQKISKNAIANLEYGSLFVTYLSNLFGYIKEKYFFKDILEEQYWDDNCCASYLMPLFQLAGSHIHMIRKHGVSQSNPIKALSSDQLTAIAEREPSKPMRSLTSDIAFIYRQHALMSAFMLRVMQYTGITVELVPIDSYYGCYRKVIIPNGFSPKYKKTIQRIPADKRVFTEVAFFPQMKNAYFDTKGIHGYSSVRDAVLPDITDAQRKELERFRQFYTGHNFTKIGETFCEYDADEGKDKYNYPFIFVALQMENDTAYDLCPFNNNQELVTFVEGCFPDWKIIFKNHPNWPAEYRISKRNLLLPVDNRDLRTLLIKSSYVVSVNSTVLLEALMYGKKCASLGEGFSTNHNVCLECHNDLPRLKELIGWEPDWKQVDRFLYFLLQKQIPIDFWKQPGGIEKVRTHLAQVGII